MTTELMKIVPISFDHLDAVSALEASAGDVHWSRAQFEKEMSLAISRFHVLLLGGQTAGYGGFWKIGTEAQVTNLVIQPELRRKGFGQIMLTALLDNARRQQCRTCTLEVRANNAAARALYLKAGFTEVGRRPGIYTNPDDDAVLMEKKL